MFGKNYADYPEILIDSFRSTSDEYKQNSNLGKYGKFIAPYIKLFGIPEIGFQLRARYFIASLKQLASLKPKKILDAGSGIGFYSFLLAARYPDAQILGVDTDDEKLRFCKQYSKENGIKNATFQKADLENFPKGKNEYDLIVNIDVLEHITNYRKVLKHFYTALKPGGYLYVHTPQDEQKRIFKTFFAHWEHEEHVREGFKPEEFKQVLIDLGFKSVTYKEGFGSFGKLAWELNHIALSKHVAFAALTFPLLSLLSRLDSKQTTRGLTLIVLAKK